MPYIYSLAGSVTLNHGTIMRLLAFDILEDTKVYNIDDQYMFGSSLMICPVTEAMYFGPDNKPLDNISKARTVYLPSGTNWYNLE